MPQDVPTEEEREELINRLVRQFEERLRKDLIIGPQTFDDIERQSQNIGEGVKEDITKEIVDECGSGYSGSRLVCECGSRTRFVGQRGRNVISLHGVVSIKRAYYYCEACRKSYCPLDRTLNLPKGQCSRSVQVLIARFCSFLPFEKAAGELEIICGIRLSATTMQHYAKRIGERLRAHWDVQEQQLYSGSAAPSQERPKRLHASMDGTIIHVGGEWREAKLGVFYQRRARGGVCNARYYATLEPSWRFGRKMRTLGHQSGTDRCCDVAIVADGAPWIWQEAGKYFPQKVQVLDFYHATEHLWQMAHARFGEGTTASQSWMSEQKRRLLGNEVSQVISDVAGWRPRRLAQQELQRKLIGYLQTHEHRMAYGTFTEQGYHIGSGVMESGCKNVVKARMGAAGMRWELPGAEAMLHLCAHWRTGNADYQPYTT